MGYSGPFLHFGLIVVVSWGFIVFFSVSFVVSVKVFCLSVSYEVLKYSVKRVFLVRILAFEAVVKIAPTTALVQSSTMLDRHRLGVQEL